MSTASAVVVFTTACSCDHYSKIIAPLTQKSPTMELMQTSFPGIGQTVTDADLRLWLITVPQIDPDGPRAAAYLRGYNVASKIATAKQQGRWPPERGFIAK